MNQIVVVDANRSNLSLNILRRLRFGITMAFETSPDEISAMIRDRGLFLIPPHQWMELENSATAIDVSWFTASPRVGMRSLFSAPVQLIPRLQSLLLVIDRAVVAEVINLPAAPTGIAP